LDGKLIAFYSDREGNFEIYVMAKDGSGVTQLTDHLDFDGFPSWQP
jgi:TolB protein